MKVYREINAAHFEAWSGGENTLDAIINAGKEDAFEGLIAELYPDGIGATALNDLLRFDDEWLFDVLDMRDDESDDDSE